MYYGCFVESSRYATGVRRVDNHKQPVTITEKRWWWPGFQCLWWNCVTRENTPLSTTIHCWYGLQSMSTTFSTSNYHLLVSKYYVAFVTLLYYIYHIIPEFKISTVKYLDRWLITSRSVWPFVKFIVRFYGCFEKGLTAFSCFLICPNLVRKWLLFLILIFHLCLRC